MTHYPQTESTLWRALPQPIIGLAPMDGVTDSAFRHIVAIHGKPDVVFTEFTNVHDICSGRLKALDSLRYSEAERPVIAQIYGKEPALFYQAAHVVCELGFDGLDINMGCPSKNVASSGSGAGLIRTPNLALELIEMARKGIQDWTAGQPLNQIGMKPKALEAIGQLQTELHHSPVRKAIPLSVKTRIGFDRNMIEEWSACLIQGRPEVISIHGRTLSQMYRGQSDWEAIALAANRIQPHGILVLGNGDIQSLGESAARIRESGVNGVLIGRGSLGNPWVFQGIQQIREMLQTGQFRNPPQHVPSLEEKFRIMIRHASLFERVHGPDRFVRMRKHLGWYCSGFPYAAAMRAQLVRTHSTTDVINLVNKYQARTLDNQDMEIPVTITAP
ncbi:tRNA dihydrouridine synthase [Candidatus Nitrospira neomarina]|uniref:tRNA-dihydrouridine synthase n=1 Tax=Candidatus Nitrospira neomarina TaxID=3020899 RepID=A0AA96GGZ0_9BACT|nr:tRNA-dihydrouridine synthase [Candidatus Nitrospira neomarina]WNM61042.1 tRNA-dihydrouridine synthase [Candidatus Nitrospira neomarina]